MVTGDKKQIYNLARKSYLVAEDIVEEKPPEKGCTFQGRSPRL